MLKTIKNQHKTLLFLLFSAVIFLFRIFYIRESNVLAIRNDEYGYWNHAALFTGHDWSDVFAGHMNWYSYGYSLILTPLFWFSHDLHLMYKTAIVLNGIFAILTFYLCIQCAKMLFPKTERWLLLTVSFMVCMYSSYITQGAIAWSETFLYLLVWLLLYLFLRFEQHPSVQHALYASLCMGACYITHNRTIGIVTAYILIVLFLRLADAIDWKLFAAMLLPLLAILFLNVEIKAYLCTAEGFGLKPKNGMGAQVSHLLSLLTLQGWRNLIRSLSGQMWALMASTFGILFWGLARCALRIIHAFATKKPEKHTTFYLFTLLACIGTFLISAISLIDPASITSLDSDTDLTYFIYTRYNECIIGILLLLGFFELAQCKSLKKLLLLTLGEACFYSAVSTLLYFNLQRITDTWHYRSFCAAGIGFYRLFSEDFSLKWCIVISAAGAFLLLLLFTILRTCFHRLRQATACILLIAAFIPTGLYSAQIGTIHSQLGKVSSGNLAMFDLLKDVVGDRDVYCTLDDTKNYRIAYELQVNLIDTHVYSITMEDLPEDPPDPLPAEEGYFICCSNGDLDSFEGDDYYLLAQSRYYAVVIKGESLMQELAPNLELELFNLNDLT
ncbi:MAG: hypothetical protein K2N87_07735 [Eubacterium sp.]|nr:hypothetical protein [Eubacterium sp.]